MKYNATYDLKTALEYIEEISTFSHSITNYVPNVGFRRTQPTVGLHAGSLLDLIIRMKKPRKILEIGTCMGFSATLMGNVCKEFGGKITSLEITPELVKLANKNIEEKNLEKTITVIEGDAKVFINSSNDSNEKFDLIFLDGPKRDYAPLIETLVNMLNDEGLLIADDVLFPVMSFLNKDKKLQKYVDDFNREIAKRNDLKTIFLPIGEGLSISFKCSS